MPLMTRVSEHIVKFVHPNREPIRCLQWSEDGEQIVYQVRLADLKTEWWQVHVETGVQEQVEPLYPTLDPVTVDKLTPAQGAVFDASLSPSGHWIVYYRTPDGYEKSKTLQAVDPTEIWISSGDTGQQSRIGEEEGPCYTFGFIGWFDNESQVLGSCAPDYGILTWWVVDIENGTLETFAQRAHISTPARSPIWSVALAPDGRVVYEDTRFQALSLVSLTQPGALEEIRVDDMEVGSPLWSQHYGSIYFLARPAQWSSGVSSVWRYDLGSEKTESVVGQEVLEAISWLDLNEEWGIAPGGESAVFVANYSLWLVTW